MSDYSDPGWRIILRSTLRRAFVPWKTPVTPDPANTTQLGTIRVIFTALVMAMFMFAFVLLYIAPLGNPGSPRGPGILIAVWGIAGILGASWARDRPLDGRSEAALAASWRSNFFIGLGISESIALAAFVTTFIVGAYWPYLLGLVLALVGMYQIAPSKRNIDRQQERLTRSGSPMSLGRIMTFGTTTTP